MFAASSFTFPLSLFSNDSASQLVALFLGTHVSVPPEFNPHDKSCVCHGIHFLSLFCVSYTILRTYWLEQWIFKVWFLCFQLSLQPKETVWLNRDDRKLCCEAYKKLVNLTGKLKCLLYPTCEDVYTWCLFSTVTSLCVLFFILK